MACWHAGGVRILPVDAADVELDIAAQVVEDAPARFLVAEAGQQVDVGRQHREHGRVIGATLAATLGTTSQPVRPSDSSGGNSVAALKTRQLSGENLVGRDGIEPLTPGFSDPSL